jgi:pSer/pThr/pTyr-binding forkhead associated (FHA) protein
LHVSLTVTEGPNKGRVFTFGEHDNFVNGRAKDAQMKFSLEDKYFSRHHFVIEVNPPKCRLMDLGSRNGTYVNGVRVTTADLRDWDLNLRQAALVRAFPSNRSQYRKWPMRWCTPITRLPRERQRRSQ